ncbi:hypothetical protein PQ455_07340 [Sphingomonas naphthae]|uniref:NusG-like N-terminal domain-containing protein n=1 Tax=Sphingomonas naphthae TaxID=1813468 RepID=A0ABY7TPV6_9SPHN|nr:transcription termination/antitermination NusG family protein [Sphingomonas naphthae]WCT75021.1 hypothetical protein PQ455_07340 [Sphingomonas naphthae]
MADRWAILRTSGGRTLALAAALAEAGYDAWTPMQVQDRRRARGRPPTEQRVPIMPTVVFVRADRVSDLYRALSLPVNPFPAFSIFQQAGRVPVISDWELDCLRSAEERAARARMKSERREFTIGGAVKVAEGILQGMVGVVVDAKGKAPTIDLGGGWVMKIEGWLLRPDDVDADDSTGRQDRQRTYRREPT